MGCSGEWWDLVVDGFGRAFDGDFGAGVCVDVDVGEGTTEWTPLILTTPFTLGVFGGTELANMLSEKL